MLHIYMLKVRLEVEMHCALYSVWNGSSITQTALCVCASVCVCMRETDGDRALRNSLAYFVSRVSMTAQWHKEQIIILVLIDNMRRKMRENACMLLCSTLAEDSMSALQSVHKAGRDTLTCCTNAHRCTKHLSSQTFWWKSVPPASLWSSSAQ